MRNRFVKTANVSRFLSGVQAIEERGAPEACLMLVWGEPGFGKSRTGAWWATHNDALSIRIKAACTPYWVLSDLLRELGITPAHTCEKAFAQAFDELAKHPRPIVVDEIENALHRDITALETLRDISDLVEVPILMIGRETVKQRLRQHRQIWSRISALVEFGPLSLADVQLCVDELSEVKVAEAVVAEIHKQSEGRIREVVKAIKNVERIGHRTADKKVGTDQVKGKVLIHEWQRIGRKAA